MAKQSTKQVIESETSICRERLEQIRGELAKHAPDSERWHGLAVLENDVRHELTALLAMAN